MLKNKRFTLAVIQIVIGITTLLCGQLYAQSYTYKNVQIRGGGFVTGLIFNPTRQNLLYARTDVGGAYKWDPGTESWTALNDALGLADQNYTGIISLATDPIDTNRVYLATGLYTQSWAGNGAILRSADRGATWTKTDLSIKLGGNEDGRSAGEMLQVDPNLNSILYLGTSANGLWKSTDYGATWAQVGSFPAPTAKVSFVLFQKNSGTAGSATPVIYVGLLQTGTNLYRSTDGGVTWSAVSGAPTTHMPHHAALSSTGILYLAYADNTGPNNITAGSVWKYNTGTAAWTQINGAIPDYTQGGYAGISVDAANPNTVIVSTMDRWWPQDEIYISTNGGTSWTKKLTTGTRSHTSAPWAAGHTPHWIGDIEIDPFNSNNVWFITGFGIYKTGNITGTPVWTFTNTGLEEIVAIELISPPSGVSLLSAVGDQDGFRHSNLDAVPADHHNPFYGTCSSIDFAQDNPNYIARTHHNSGSNMGAYSTDQGITWTNFGSYPASGFGGVIAIAANASRMVWAPDGGAAVSYSTNNGSTWTASTGINSGVYPEADRVNSNKFYAYDATNGNVLVSTNGGASFATAATGFTAVPSWYLWTSGVKAVFGIEGDVWLHNPDGLYHSTNSGASFTQIANVGFTYDVAFGKSLTSGGYPAVYIVGNVNGVYGFYRSDNGGTSWTRINDDNHQFGGINALAADPNIYGRVYLGTAGRGIIYGDIASSLPLDLLAFTVSPIQNNGKTIARLQWQTANEVNTSHFNIERSTDGIGWTKAGTVSSNSANATYHFEDDLTGVNTTVYYRLEMVDIGGATTYSKVVSVKTGNNFVKTTVSARPNPVTAGSIWRLHIQSDKNMAAYIKISDNYGREVYRSAVVQVQEGHNTIAVTELLQQPSGVYYAEVLTADSGSRIGLVKVVRQ